MDFSYFKYLVYINKQLKIHWIDLTSAFDLSKSEALEIVRVLVNNGYISKIGDTCYIPTFKGKHFVKSMISQWLYNNLLAIIAIIISIIALFN